MSEPETSRVLGGVRVLEGAAERVHLAPLRLLDDVECLPDYWDD